MMMRHRQSLLTIFVIVFFCSVSIFDTKDRVAPLDPSGFSAVPSSTWVNKNCLRPPFKIVQIGKPRTGSTFQYELLRAMVALKSPRDTKIQSRFIFSWSSDPFNGTFDLTSNSTFIIKTHAPDDAIEKASHDGLLAVFSSSEIVPYSIYTHKRANIERCSECEVEKYQSIFNLTDDDIEVLQHHMQDFTILRQW
jgi:hypothetical protein